MPRERRRADGEVDEMAVIGTGLSITFDSGFFAEILDVNWSGITRASYETSSMSTTTARTYAPGDLYDAGTLVVNMAFDTTQLPSFGAAETCTVTLSNADTWAASAFVTDFAITVPLEDRMTAAVTLKFSGAITVTP